MGRRGLMMWRHDRTHVVLDEGSRLRRGLSQAGISLLGRGTIQVPEDIPPVGQEARAFWCVEVDRFIVANLLKE